jgi:hypothetical protein
MTETGRWLEKRRRELTRRFAGAWLAVALGGALGAFALGAVLGRLGLYRAAPVAVLLAWAVAPAVIALGFLAFRRRRRGLAVRELARTVERAGGARDGAIGGAAAWHQGSGSASLAAAQDRWAAGWLAEHGRGALTVVRRGSRRTLATGGVALAAGALVFAAARPFSGRGAEVWNPFAVIARARGPVQLGVDRETVRRGDSVRVLVRAQGRRDAVLWMRAPGVEWAATTLALDTLGEASHVVGPLDADRFFRATSGNRSSETIHVDVLLPAFLADLALTARYPAYLGLPSEPLAADGDAVLLPVGTRVELAARATTELGSGQWRAEAGRGGQEGAGAASVRLTISGDVVHGTLAIGRSAEWTLHVTTADGAPLEGEPPVLNVIAVPDSAPVVTVPVPGADTVAPLDLKQPLVVDARDDYRITGVDLVSWRVSRLGQRGDTQVAAIPVPEGGAERTVLHASLDLEQRGLLPGDTLFYQVRARDNAPGPNVGRSPVFRLRLASMAELRAATRAAARDASGAADSLAQAQRDLVRQLEELATERQRSEAGARAGDEARRGDQLPFSSVEQAQELLSDQERLAERARRLRDEVQQLADQAWQAGITDPEFQRQLRDLENLLERAMTDELAQRLQELREAMDRLDAPAARDALERLAQAAEQLRQELERSRELFERAAVEGEMSTLAQDAEELSRQQQRWNEAAGREGVDSMMAAAEQQLSKQTQELADALRQLQAAIDSSQLTGDVRQSGEQARQASGQMGQASQSAQQGNQQGAQQAGHEASQSLDPVAEQIRQERGRLQEAWRQEVAGAINRAMVEASDLAQAQEGVQQRLQRGESGADVRGEQAAVREGVDRVLQRLQEASGKNALVSPQLGAQLGAAKVRMGEALEQLQRSSPNTRDASASAGQALDALNAIVYALLDAQGEVQGAQSGSGLQEAMEQMAQMAQQQGGLNAETGGLLPMMSQGGEQLLSELRALAERQRALADQLEGINAQGDVTGADQLAQEAGEIARDLDQGRLDRETVERQEQLFRRLLDAGRTLRSDEEDEREDRISQTADPSIVQPPPRTLSGEQGGPRFRYPSWEELQKLSPEERRLILDYFRRLNERRP